MGFVSLRSISSTFVLSWLVLITQTSYFLDIVGHSVGLSVLLCRLSAL